MDNHIKQNIIENILNQSMLVSNSNLILVKKKTEDTSTGNYFDFTFENKEEIKLNITYHEKFSKYPENLFYTIINSTNNSIPLQSYFIDNGFNLNVSAFLEKNSQKLEVKLRELIIMIDNIFKNDSKLQNILVGKGWENIRINPNDYTV